MLHRDRVARSFPRTLLVALISIIVLVNSASAVRIQLAYYSEGREIPSVGLATAPPANTTGGGSLRSVVRAAADAWEALIADDFTLRLNVGWTDTTGVSSRAYHQGINVGGDPQRQTEGSIVFNSQTTVPFFLDPTPYNDEEFQFSQQLFDDLGGGLVGSRKAYTGLTPEIIGANDVYSSAVHEIGHALGLVRWPFFNNETADGDIDITSGPFAGMTLPMRSSHFDFSGPVLSRFGRPLGERRKITQVDLAAVCQVSQFDACDYDFRPGDPEGDYNGDGTVDAADYTVWLREARSTNILPGDTTPGLVRLNDWHVWRANYGATADWVTTGNGAFAAGAAQVPEPGGLVMVFVATGMSVYRQSVVRRG